MQTSPYHLVPGPESSPGSVEFIGAGDEAIAAGEKTRDVSS